jgi:hypothetical protein
LLRDGRFAAESMPCTGPALLVRASDRCSSMQCARHCARAVMLHYISSRGSVDDLTAWSTQLRSSSIDDIIVMMQCAMACCLFVTSRMAYMPATR